jgi:hypothetical protein
LPESLFLKYKSKAPKTEKMPAKVNFLNKIMIQCSCLEQTVFFTCICDVLVCFRFVEHLLIKKDTCLQLWRIASIHFIAKYLNRTVFFERIHKCLHEYDEEFNEIFEDFNNKIKFMASLNIINLLK